ncbi:MAG: hypothetical protein AAGH79_13720 [Bacteroidota bacterium]
MASSSDKQLHIVSLNVPYPANYGGVIDIYYKIRALQDLGIRIHLHCYDYGRGPQSELEKVCASVHYYTRATGWRSQLSRLPYIIQSRSSSALLKRLQQDDVPILLEGLHTAYWLLKGALAPERVILRSHNIEHEYYRALAQQTKGWKRWYFQKEAWQLEQVLNQLPPATRMAAISPPDTTFYQKRWPNTFWLPPFHPNTEVDIKLGRGNYALYHGNLSVVENVQAALFLVGQFGGRSIPLKLAGKDPAPELVTKVAPHANVEIVASPKDEQMQLLVQHAQVLVLPTFQSTGIKLKLLESLYKGRHVVVNPTMVHGTGLENLCTVVKEDFLSAAQHLWGLDFQEEQLAQRQRGLANHFDNRENAQSLIQMIWG